VSVSLLIAIEKHLRRSGTPPTRFGREAVGDPRFVLDLRNGREARAKTAARVSAYLAQIQAEGGR
jgi:hypothetical protein